jgi:hypothetical protein
MGGVSTRYSAQKGGAALSAPKSVSRMRLAIAAKSRGRANTASVPPPLGMELNGSTANLRRTC